MPAALCTIIQGVSEELVKLAIRVGRASFGELHRLGGFTCNDQLPEFLAGERGEGGDLLPAAHAVRWERLAVGCCVFHVCLTLQVAAKVQRIDARLGVGLNPVTGASSAQGTLC